jgi:uncharacterized protein (TIGR02001 family)
MRTSIFGLSAVALAALATPALAQDAAESNSDLTLTAGASLVTDYRFRGVSQNDESFAVQGTLGVSHSSGAYVGVWGSSVDFAGGIDRAGAPESITSEIDIYAGYKAPVGPATADVGVVYYYYPDAGFLPNGDDVASDYAEIYASLSGSVGPASVKVGAAYAPKTKALNNPVPLPSDKGVRDDNVYVYGDVAYSLGDIAPLTVKGHLGSSFGRSLLTFGQKNYLDWSVGADYTWKNLTLGVAYVDTDLKTNSRYFYNYDLADSTVVGSITVAF